MLSQSSTDVGPKFIKEVTDAILREAGKVIVGKSEVIKAVLTALYCGGHVLLEGVPGVAKTLIAKTIARAFSMTYSRIQATPDLLPADIIGTFIYDPKTSEFRLRKGPVFANIVLFDEINRASPRTQSALLETMQERQVTIEGMTFRLPEPFIVIATQNPIEMEGTFPLPEAQLDRFLLKVDVGLPTHEEMKEILRRSHYIERFEVEPVAGAEHVLRVRVMLPEVRVGEEVEEYIVNLIEETHRQPTVKLGGSPRAAISLYLTSKVNALMNGRDFVIPDDVKEMAPHVLRHRIILSPEAELEGVTPDKVVENVLRSVPVPTPGVEG
ncbi:MAG: MoxR family ATPase [Desulfurococcales archaeon]|nr:MoxR family ATPase [Desulfurococcales archaeon]